MIEIPREATPSPWQAISLRCPHCRHASALLPIHAEVRDIGWNALITGDDGKKYSEVGYGAGLRKCPRPECYGLIFVAYRPEGPIVAYPPETIDFDASALPERILSTLEEAVKCHAAGAFRATALMVRRILEELCDDRQAVGENLAKRLKALGATVIVPDELLRAADELRLLGNDAAHIEGKAYDSVGRTEAELAIELAKELLKAVYQYQSLVDRLRALKKS